ncbi:hypothetical protein [Mycolicibacter engbaekii]|uniref:hypothetical protein n=1 Tax=Mycolicibacter engbaekii TaxID=188915 RepID=UPI0013FDB0F1|nr:hypothetical protein [Mycolicibacter engbaekii]
MDLESLASLIDALAWPVIVIVGLLLFQKPLRLWLKERPQRLKVGPFEAEWASAAARTQVALESESELVGPPSSASNASWGSVDSPAAAIIHESTSLEVTLRRALQEAGVEDESLGLAALAKQAADASLIDVRTATALEGIATMRNLAVHSPGRITAEQAAQFAELAQSTASVG